MKPLTSERKWMHKSKSRLYEKYKTLPSRIAQLRSEANELIDAKVAAERVECPGVPSESIRNLLTAPYAFDVIDAALAILSKEKEIWIMATKKTKGDGPFSAPAKLTEYRGPDVNGNAKGTSIAKEIWENNDSAGVRGGHPDRDKTGR
jgi:hypothetical protein